MKYTYICDCYNKGICNACLYYKSISEIISTTDLNVIDPATFIREKINSNFEITIEECEILERIKNTNMNDYSEYKTYLLKPSHYIQCDNRLIIKCPNCYDNINIIVTSINTNYICCTEFLNNKIHDARCMNFKYKIESYKTV